MIFVGNLDYKSTYEDIADLFSKCGEVVDVRIAAYRDGRKKGFAHVEFSTNEAAKDALQFHGHEFDGRELRIDLSEGYKPEQAADAQPETQTQDVDAEETENAENAD